MPSLLRSLATLVCCDYPQLASSIASACRTKSTRPFPGRNRAEPDATKASDFGVAGAARFALDESVLPRCDRIARSDCPSRHQVFVNMSHRAAHAQTRMGRNST